MDNKKVVCSGWPDCQQELCPHFGPHEPEKIEGHDCDDLSVICMVTGEDERCCEHE